MIVKKECNKANVLDRVNQYDIFKHYNFHFQKLGQKFCSEVRKDSSPTCCIGKYGNKLLYRDFSEPNSLDCFAYIQLKYGVNFQESLEMINMDFNLNLISFKKIIRNTTLASKTNFNIEKAQKMPTEIKVKIRKWNKHDRRYWNNKYEFNIKDLKKFNIYPLDGFWMNNRYFKAGYNTYGYYFGKLKDNRNAWKIYQPNDTKGGKWFSNTTEEIFQGFNQLPLFGDILIITKSLKDVVVLYKLGINAIAPQGESIIITYELVKSLKKRFKTIFVLYDNDKAGIIATNKIVKTHNLIAFYMPSIVKDASDFVEAYGYDKLSNYLEIGEWKN